MRRWGAVRRAPSPLSAPPSQTTSQRNGNVPCVDDGLDEAANCRTEWRASLLGALDSAAVSARGAPRHDRADCGKKRDPRGDDSQITNPSGVRPLTTPPTKEAVVRRKVCAKPAYPRSRQSQSDAIHVLDCSGVASRGVLQSTRNAQHGGCRRWRVELQRPTALEHCGSEARRRQWVVLRH